MSGSDNSKLCGDVDKMSSDNKTCTSYAQKVEHCKKDGVENRGDNKSNNNTDINALSDGMGGLDISDDKLFADPPPKEDCPICMLPIPHNPNICGVGRYYQPCCGKILCRGCIMVSREEMRKGTMKLLCPFCRAPIPENKDLLSRLKKRMKQNDVEAFYELASIYATGGRRFGLSKDSNKALELLNRAAELGSSKAHYQLGMSYLNGVDVKSDMEKAFRHWELAAIGGDEKARAALGAAAAVDGNIAIAMKHYIIAARSGFEGCLKAVGEGYKDGHVTKDEYAKTLRACQYSCDGMKSEQRTKANSEDEGLK